MPSWEMKWVSTPDDILHVITTRLARPVGLYLFGVSEARQIVLQELFENLHTAFYHSDFYEHHRDEVLSCTREQVVILNIHNHTAKPSSPHRYTVAPEAQRRRDAIALLRRSGRQSIVGIYAAANNFASLRDESYRIAKSLRNYPPQPDPTIGENYLITVHCEIKREPRL